MGLWGVFLVQIVAFLGCVPGLNQQAVCHLNTSNNRVFNTCEFHQNSNLSYESTKNPMNSLLSISYDNDVLS